MIAGLRQAEAAVECRAQLWTGIDGRVQAVRGGWLRPRFWWRLLSAYLSLLRQYRVTGAYDVLMVGSLGQFGVLRRVEGRPCVCPSF